MAFVKCSVGGCSRRLQPVLKVNPRDRETWLYPECEECGRPSCAEHTSESDGRFVCDRCRKQIEERDSPVELLQLDFSRLDRR